MYLNSYEDHENSMSLVEELKLQLNGFYFRDSYLCSKESIKSKFRDSKM